MRQSCGIAAGAWGEIETGVGGSCGTSVDKGWRAQQQLRRRESFDDVHGTSANGAVPVCGGTGLIGGEGCGTRSENR